MTDANDNILRFERRRLERRVPGLGVCSFAALGGRAELKLARHYEADEPDHRAFVNELIAATVETPAVDAARVDALSERARAIARVAAAEVCGCGARYRRLAGSGPQRRRAAVLRDARALRGASRASGGDERRRHRQRRPHRRAGA